MRETVICEPVHTAVGGYGGQFKPLTAVELGVAAVRGLVERAGIGPDAIDEVILGHCYPNSDAPAIGRVVALDAGLDVATGGPLGPRVSLGPAAVTSITAVGATAATGSADGAIHRIAADGTAVRVADLYPAQGSGDVRVGAVGGDDVVAVGDETASRVLTLRTETADERICTATGC